MGAIQTSPTQSKGRCVLLEYCCSDGAKTITVVRTYLPPTNDWPMRYCAMLTVFPVPVGPQVRTCLPPRMSRSSKYVLRTPSVVGTMIWTHATKNIKWYIVWFVWSRSVARWWIRWFRLSKCVDAFVFQSFIRGVGELVPKMSLTTYSRQD